MVRWVHEAADAGVPVVLNSAAWSHYSYALRDACAQLTAPLVEVHISQVHAREEFRHTSVISAVATATITGLGIEGYRAALRYLAQPSVGCAGMATTNDLKNGMVLNLDNGLWAVNEFQHVKPGKGGAFVRTTLKNVLTGKVVDKTFNAGTKVEVATVDKRTMTYLYKEGTDYVFMDQDTFDQLYVPEQTLGTVKDYLLENMEAMVAMHEGAALYVELPASVELVVAHTDPGLQGDRSTGGTKPATLETGAEIQVPLFLTTGEKIKVDTRDGRYLGRVNEK